MTSKEIGALLAQIYNIESKQCKKGIKVPPIDFLFNKIYNSNHGTFDKKTNINTIKSFLTLEDIINQNSLDDLSLKVLRNLVNERIKEIEKEAIEINSIEELFV